jgi:hypothetical protein
MKTFNLKFSIDISIDADTQLEAIKEATMLVEDISWDSKLLKIEEEDNNHLACDHAT